MLVHCSKLGIGTSLPGFAGLLVEAEGGGITAAKSADALKAPMHHQVT